MFKLVYIANGLFFCDTEETMPKKIIGEAHISWELDLDVTKLNHLHNKKVDGHLFAKGESKFLIVNKIY